MVPEDTSWMPGPYGECRRKDERERERDNQTQTDCGVGVWDFGRTSFRGVVDSVIIE